MLRLSDHKTLGPKTMSNTCPKCSRRMLVHHRHTNGIEYICKHHTPWVHSWGQEPIDLPSPPQETNGGLVFLNTYKPAMSTWDTEASHHGGDLTINGGSGWAPAGGTPVHGNIIFKLPDGTEMLRFNGMGSVFVRGKYEENNKKLIEAFAGWLAMATGYKP